MLDGFLTILVKIFRCQTDFDNISSGYLSKISLICLTFFSLSGIITSSGPSPYHNSGMSFEIIITALTPTIFHVHEPEYLSIAYSSVPNVFKVIS